MSRPAISNTRSLFTPIVASHSLLLFFFFDKPTAQGLEIVTLTLQRSHKRPHWSPVKVHAGPGT